ncbi:DDE-type integrase/transposase/recombinase [Arthrobacter sp. CG_A4]|uniref:DDE-type integrase/transposase/recombinase n=1 Tax=Arthrobacter sp. CG_A4 TaxID=3071706 RepID=UPI002DFE12EC|nr:transposase InsO family protein [Arthrobacter sp. CG_A4]
MDGVERWRVLRLHVEDQVPLATIARETGISPRTLQRWHQLYRTGGISTLDPHARSDAGTRRTAAETVAFIERHALTKPRPSLATLHRLAVAEAQRRGSPEPGYSTVREIVRALDPALVTFALEGPAAYRDRHEIVFRRRADHPNQIWQADHTELDILIVGADGRPDRPWLTTVMNDYSRAICGYTVFTGAPSALNTALALRQAIWCKTDPGWAMCGIPDILHVDHGSDFTSHHLERTAVELHIRIIHSTVARGEGRSSASSAPSTLSCSPRSPDTSDQGAERHNLSWIFPGSIARLAPSSPPTTTGRTASWVRARATPGSPTAGFLGCPRAWRSSTGSS